MKIETEQSTIERKRLVNKLRVTYPARASVLDLLDKCLVDSGHSAEPKSLFIGGDTGVGKSTLIRAFVARHPRVRGEIVDRIPVLCASIPPVATTKGTVSAILQELGDPKAFEGALSKLTARLLGYIKDCDVQMLVLDEFQHVIDRESSKVLSRTADLLKTILDGSKKPLVLVGLPHSERILDENPQLDRRFPRRTLLERFRWDSPEGKADFQKLLSLVDTHLPFDVPAGLDHPATAAWFFKYTDGTLGLVMSLIREASERAIDRGAERLEMQDLEAARRMMRGTNPRRQKKAPVIGRGRFKGQPDLDQVLRT